MSVRLALDVWLDGQAVPVGRLEALDRGDTRFTYTGNGPAISLSLPPDAGPAGDVVTRAFFDNLLPENDEVERTMEREGLERSDIVGILAHVGADCPGAISCLPVGAPPMKVPGDLSADYRPLDEGELAAIVNALADRRPLPLDIVDPSPVAGVQRKIAVTLLPDGRLALPADDRKVPTTHILKVPRRAEAIEALQEEAALRLAEACGFAASVSRHVPIADVDTLLIERFDRVVVEGVVYRLHQEDFAQALGLPATLKYERWGKPGRRFDAAAVRELLSRLSRPIQATETFLLATIFNLAIGNTDNHAKNHAILHGPDGAHLAPLYDLLPIRLSHRYTDQLAYDVGTATHFDAMTADDLDAFLELFGLVGTRRRRFVQDAVRPMLATLEAAAPRLRPIGLRFFDDLIGREVGRLSELLDLDLDVRPRDWLAPTGGGWLAGS